MSRPFLTGILLFTAAANLSAGVFMHIEGIPGESTSTRHSQWIDIQSYSWGVQKTTNIPPSFSDLNFIKAADQASPRLLLHVANARVVPTAALDVIRPGDSEVRYLSLKFKDILISSYQAAGSAGSAPSDSFSLRFSSVQWTYTEVKGGRALRDIKTSFDLRTQTGSGGDIPADGDNDGLPDEYERLYGLNVELDDAGSDLDSDSMTNIEEFRAGTAPNSPNSTFRVSGARNAAGDASLSWEPAAGKTYRMLGASSPDQPFEFVRFLTEAEAAAGQLNFPPVGAFRFFILEVD